MEAEDRAHEVGQGVVAKVRGHIRHAQALARHQLHSLQQPITAVNNRKNRADICAFNTLVRSSSSSPRI